MEKLIINAALTGMVPRKKDCPSLPVTVDEIIADAKRCRDEGASVVHIHARSAEDKPTCKAEVYQEIISGIRTKCPDLLISGSTSGRIHKRFCQRAAVLDCRPDFGSLTLGSLNFPRQASVNDPTMIKSLALAMNNRGIVPEMEFFDLGMVDYARYLCRKGILKKPHYCNILLGSLGTLSAGAHNLALMVNALPQDTTWSATGIGRFQYSVNAMAVVMGGHVRVGLEDNIYYDTDKRHLATNPGLVARIAKLAAQYGRQIASPDEARAIIGLPPRQTAHPTETKTVLTYHPPDTIPAGRGQRVAGEVSGPAW